MKLGAVVELEPGEELLRSAAEDPERPSIHAALLTNRWFAVAGGLYLTNRRLLFIPTTRELVAKEWMARHQCMISLGDVEAAETTGRFPLTWLFLPLWGRGKNGSLWRILLGPFYAFFTHRLAVRSGSRDFVFDVAAAAEWAQAIGEAAQKARLGTA